MAVVSIGRNLVSLRTTGLLNKTTQALSESYGRLSSGLRIQKASDDPAGLSLSSKLNADTKIYSRAILNANDGISLLNTANGATDQLSNILTRIKELAVQSANGVLSLAQRRAIDSEGSQLTDEYNRIIQSVEFNNRKLLDGNLGDLALQIGYGTNGYLSFGVGTELDKSVGTGSFASALSFATDTSPYDLATADVNGDGKIDVLSVGIISDKLNVLLGNGDGTLLAPVSYAVNGAQNPAYIEAADVNQDGYIDAIITNTLDDTVNILIGNGNGTFKASVSYSVGDAPESLTLQDLNNDGELDIVSSSNNDQKLYVLLGNGNGSFKAKVSYPSTTTPADVTIADFNGDGIYDIATAQLDDGVNIFLGNGDGSFKSSIRYSGGDRTTSARAIDLNYDGVLDIVTGSGDDDKLNVLIGNGDGTFKVNVSYALGITGVTFRAETTDINGDGFTDVAVSGTGGTTSILIGNGDGTFRAATSVSTGTTTQYLSVADMNGDGVPDLIVSSNGSGKINVSLATTTQSTTIPRLNLTTKETAQASIAIVESALDRVRMEYGSLGAAQNRLSSVLNRLNSVRDSFSQAQSRIVDVDVAEESARLVSKQILQQAQVSLLAQANQSPSIALMLLDS